MTADHKIALHDLLSHTVVPSPPLEFTVDMTYWQLNKNVQENVASSNAGDNWSVFFPTLLSLVSKLKLFFLDQCGPVLQLISDIGLEILTLVSL